MKCFIILPCFNEEKNLKPLIHSIDNVLSSHLPYQIIAVNDGSIDRTKDILKDLSAEFPIKVLEHSKNYGLAAALKTGLIAAVEESFDDDFVITMDSDNTHDPKHVLDMLIAVENADVVVGSRYVEGGAQLNVPLDRAILSRMVNLLVEKLFHLRLKDATSGFRCFRAGLLRRLYNTFGNGIIESRGFTASLELLLKAVAFGGVVAEVPIRLDYGKKNGKSKMHLFSTVFNYLALLFRFKLKNNLKCFG
jgi:dolichol-phosphate mannosyltransferase